MSGRPIAVATGRVQIGPRTTRSIVVGAVLAIAGLVVLRLRTMHPGMLYPDGYQYLLMARGIGQHLQPVAALGAGGDTVAPSADAAAKPLYPALVALIEGAGLSPFEAAHLLAALAGAMVAPLAGFLTLRLSGSRGAALLTAVLCLASPTLGFWLGFAGPEGLAQALGLAAALAFLYRRPVVGGVLAGLTVTARPEFFVLAVAAALAAGASARTRREAMLGSTCALATIATVIGVLRPPLASQTLVQFAAAIVLGVVAAGALAGSGLASRRTAISLAVGFNALLLLALARGDGWNSVARRDWPLLALAAAGLIIGVSRQGSRTNTLRMATFLLVGALAYWWKNPGSERYVAILLPGFAVLAGLGVGRLRPSVLTAAAALSLVGAVLSPTFASGPDTFQGIAERLGHGPQGTLVTAAPDAYGVLLPGRAVRAMRPGATGLILVDGAARAYEPHLAIRGRLIEQIPADEGFTRPNGSIDDTPALLYRGTVTR
jgi:hypothetical protein